MLSQSAKTVMSLMGMAPGKTLWIKVDKLNPEEAFNTGTL